MNMSKMNTVYCAAATPMNRDESVDYGGLAANIAWYSRQGIGGILVCGGTGEFVSLSCEERTKIVEKAAKANSRKCQLMAGCAAETTREAVYYARHAEDSGADSLLLITPFYFKPSRDELAAHFCSVAGAVGIPVILYNNPASTGCDITLETLKLLYGIPNIRGIKEATGDVNRIHQINSEKIPDFQLWCGCDAIVKEFLLTGSRGWISITANVLASQCQRMMDLAGLGRFDELDGMLGRYQRLFEVCESPYKAIQTVKFMMDCLGLAGGASRKPRLPLTEPEKAKVLALMDAAGLPRAGQ